MALGISTACLYPMLMEDSLETLIDLGFHQFEIFINTYSEMEPEFLAMLEKKLRRGGCKVKSCIRLLRGLSPICCFQL